MDLVVRCHRLPNDSLCKEAMKTAIDQPKKKSIQFFLCVAFFSYRVRMNRHVTDG